MAMLMIVWWHFGAPTNMIDWGARMCEFLFVSSGFLVGYNYYYRSMESTWTQSCDYTHKKARTIFPLHIITTILILLICFDQYILGFKLSDIPILLSNLFLLQAWSPDVTNVCCSYNGHTWFLSALLFCYFVTPFIIKAIKNKKFAIFMFFAVAILRFGIEFATRSGVEIFSIRVHTSPIIRLMEYFMGMLMVPLFMAFKDKTKEIKNKVYFKLIWTIVEAALITLLILLMYWFNKTWLRAYYVYIFCIFVFFIAQDYGYFSKFCSFKCISYICQFQLEVYMFQNIAGKVTTKLVAWFSISYVWLWVLIFLTLLFGLAILYRLFIEEKLAKVMDKLYAKAKSIFMPPPQKS